MRTCGISGTTLLSRLHAPWEEGLLDFLPPAERGMLTTAIRSHNKYAIDPDVVDPDTLTLCKLIRDADKVDILRVFSSESAEAITGEQGYCRLS